MLRLTSRGPWFPLAVLGAAATVWACTPPKVVEDAGDSGPSDAGGDNDSGPRDAGVDGGRDGGVDGGPDSGCVADAACGITTPPQAGDPGWRCTEDTQCNPTTGGFCQTSFHRCSRPCGTIADCPVSWTCAPLTAGGANVCQCPVKPPATDTCNNVDDNCDGLVDNGQDLCPIAQACTSGACACPAANQCGGLCTDKQTDVTNCGACGHACDEGYVCVGGGCTCPSSISNFICSVYATDGGTVDAGPTVVCVDSTTDPRHCGACENHCPPNEDCIDSSCQESDHEWARWSLKSAPVYSSGSVPGPSDTMIATVNEAVSGLVWQRDVSASSYTWLNAAAYCSGLGTGWRVPSRIELLSLVDYTHFAPALDQTVFPQSPASWRSTVFWSASSKASLATMAWSVDFASGYSNTQPKSSSFPVRCVQ